MPYADPEQRRAYQRAYKQKHKERLREHERARVAALPPEKRRKHDPVKYREHYYANREERIERVKRYYREHLAERRAYNQQRYSKLREDPEYRRAAVERATSWAKANPERHRAHMLRTKAKRRSVEVAQFSPAELEARLDYLGRRCIYCGGELQHIDHVIPLSRGGAHALHNLVPACAACNMQKHNAAPLEWLTRRAVRLKGRARKAILDAISAAQGELFPCRAT